MAFLPGILICVVIGAVSFFAAKLIPLGAVTISIIIGLLIANIVPLPSSVKKGQTFCEKKLLSIAIALLGFSLDYRVLFSLGFLPLLAILTGVPITILTALLLGRIFKIDEECSLLVGVGNAVCGSSAIAAAQGVIKTKDEYVGLSIAVINLLGTIGIFLIPGIVYLVPGITEQLGGILAGNTIQAVGQVTAAGYNMGDLAGQTAIVIKMGRVLLITPLVLILGIFYKNKDTAKVAGKVSMPGVPPFIIAFIIFSVINSIGIIPDVIVNALKTCGELFLIVAMAGIGMKISFKSLKQDGSTALLLGVCVWAVQILYSLFLIKALS
ncbi:MAG: putative sulfate exporter family transporter [Spirochaetales bacterium]|nr:putative sulfate exporter family transporter [Spirochaetales bacterium]